MPPLDRPEVGIVLCEGPGEVRAVRIAGGEIVAFAALREGEMPLGTICRAVVRAHLPDVGSFLDIGTEAFLAGTALANLPLGTRLLVQISRAASGDKPIGVTRSLTWETPALALSLRAGGMGEVSAARTLPDTERARLKAFLAEQLSDQRRAAGFSVTVRLPALACKQAALAAQLQDLLAEADAVDPQGQPGPVAGGGVSLRRLLADLGSGAAELPLLAPLALAPRLKAEGMSFELAPPSVDPFAALEIDAELAEACAPEIPLSGGGRLYIEVTRALTAIDLDSGGDSRSAETCVTEGLRAAARLIRLRNLSGIILIDPPRLGTAALTRALAAFTAALAADPIASDLLGTTRGGLIEIARPHRGPPLVQRLFAAEGRALAILRGLVYGPPVQSALPVAADELAWLDSAPGMAARAAAARRLGQPPAFRLRGE